MNMSENISELQKILQKGYNRNVWTGVLKSVFCVKDMQVTPKSLGYINNENVEGVELGRLSTSDGYEIGIYEFEIKKKYRIDMNLVGLRRLLDGYTKFKVDAALVVYYDEKQWRLSFICNLKDNVTSTKRFTYLFGNPDETYHTAITRFEQLQKNSVTFKNIHEAFSVGELSTEFYDELFKWYEWALSEEIGVTFPNDVSIVSDDRKIEEHLIRLITRLMFVWFIKQKELIPNDIFKIDRLNLLLKDFNPTDKIKDNYYRAILQNLFFATLNQKINEREFVYDDDDKKARKEHYGIKTLYRYKDEFAVSSDEVKDLFSTVPFLNGGLFECLDKETIDSRGRIVYSDGFSRKDGRQSRAHIPNVLFFDTEKGLIPLLSRYNFTIEENSPNDVQVALDPELLGKVFENLLGAYNPETRETARKSSGSFYTPREIVDYMVDESLIAHLTTHCPDVNSELIRELFASEVAPEGLQSKQVMISEQLKEIKILDPACGSGAFPMGVLNRMLDILEKLNNECRTYELKLHLIENCIYGIDIQIIAVQISKLRFFISLIVNQERDESKENFGILPLPNLETKFVAANTLIGINKKKVGDFYGSLFDDPEIDVVKGQLRDIRHRHFSAKSSQQKKVYREEDKQLRNRLLELFSKNELCTQDEARQLADWNPYDQNESSRFFDLEWMFGLDEGFDIVIGNPPYLSTKGVSDEEKTILIQNFGFADDLYSHFYFRGFNSLLKNKGNISYITPKTFWTTQTKRNLRDLLLSNSISYIFDTANPFKSVLVDTCIVSISKQNERKDIIRFMDGSKDFINHDIFYINQQFFCDTQNSVIFKPTPQNLKIFELYGLKVKELYNTWWDKISTSKKISECGKILEEYRHNLKPGDIALLGCLTEGGQGLATANNGKYIAVRKSTKWSSKIIESRPKKLNDAIKTYKIHIESLSKFKSTCDFLASLSEQEIATLFDELKEKYGRDIFGQGYLYRIVADSEIADVDTLTDEEKSDGIDVSNKYYVPYDKGDKDGNRWYLETPFAIAWSKENVHFLKTYSGKKGAGMPVVRNTQFNFKEGFCWTDVNSTYLKARLKRKGIFDVLSMSLFTQISIPDWYFVCLINSRLLSFYVDNFVNNTSHFQINDARQLPVIIPSVEQLKELELIFNHAYEIKQNQYKKCIHIDIAEEQLKEIQNKLDYFIDKLYGMI